MHKKIRFIAVLLSLSALTSQAAFAQADVFETRARTVEVLLEANKRLAEESGGEQRGLMRQVQDQLDAAKSARDKGNEKKAAVLLDAAYTDLKRAIAVMASRREPLAEQLGGEDPQDVQRMAKAAREYQNLSNSVAALGDAYVRIREEERSEKADLSPAIIAISNEAEKLRQTGDLLRGHARLHHAYTLLQGAIGDLRGGDTLVRSLNFATPEDEYRYEEERYENLRLVTRLLTERKRSDARVEKMIALADEQAAFERENARAAAEQGEFATAVQHMEAAAAALIKGVRSAGIYLP